MFFVLRSMIQRRCLASIHIYIYMKCWPVSAPHCINRCVTGSSSRLTARPAYLAVSSDFRHGKVTFTALYVITCTASVQYHWLMSVALSSRSQVQFSATFNQREINACASSWLEIKLKGKKLSACFAFNFCLRRQTGGHYRAIGSQPLNHAGFEQLMSIGEGEREFKQGLPFPEWGRYWTRKSLC